MHTLRADIDYATSRAHTTYGTIGVKVWICRGTILDRGDFTPDGREDRQFEGRPEAAMGRRGVELTDADVELLTYTRQVTKEERTKIIKKARR